MYCTQCGSEITTQARYCSQCGQPTGNSPDPAAGPSAPKRLLRIARDKKIAGVCAGFAYYLNVDVTLVRILTIAVCFVTGFIPVALAYIFAWIIMPVLEAPPPPRQVYHQTPVANPGA